MGNIQDSGGNAFDWASTLGGQAGDAYMGSGNTVDQIGTYMNPYTDQVIDRTMDNMVRMNQQLLNRSGDLAEANSAFGGARHGLVDAVTNAETVRAMGDTSANLYNQAYNTAANLAQGHVGQDLARGQALQGLGRDAFNMGNNLLAQQSRQANMAHRTNQAVMDMINNISQSNNPMALAQALQSSLSGSPLTGNQVVFGTETPSGAEKFGTILGAAGDAMTGFGSI